MMNVFVGLWHPDLVTITASVLGGIVAFGAVLMSVNVFRHEGNAGTISPKKRTHAFMLVALAIVSGAIGLLIAHAGAAWLSVHALATIAIASLSLYERNNSTQLIRRLAVRAAFGAGLIALSLVIMTLNPFQFSSSITTAQVAFILALLGYGVALGIAPMHIGLSELYSKIPSPISALVAPLSLLIGVIDLFRLRAEVDVVIADSGAWTGAVLIAFGLITVLVLSGTLLRQHNYKKFFAELTMFHTGALFLFAGFGVAGTIPALMHLGITAIMTSALFCVAGMLHATYKTTKFSGIRNIFKLLPVPSVLLGLVCLGALGVPVSGMFMSMMIGIGYGLQFHLVLTLFLVLSWCLVIAAVSARLFDLTHASQDDAIALLPVRWRMSSSILCIECFVMLLAVWWIGTQEGIAFFVDAAQSITTF